jgi:hypothetical protein
MHRVRSALRDVGRSFTQRFLRKRKPQSGWMFSFSGKADMSRTSRDVAEMIPLRTLGGADVARDPVIR